MTLTFDIHIGSFTHLVSEKSIVLLFSRTKAEELGTKFDLVIK